MQILIKDKTEVGQTKTTEIGEGLGIVKFIPIVDKSSRILSTFNENLLGISYALLEENFAGSRFFCQN